MSSAPWPLFALRVRTPRLLLRPADDTDLEGLADLAAAGVHPAGTMPFTSAWTDAPPEELRRRLMQHHWGLRAQLDREHWTVAFAVVLGGELVGMQNLAATGFAAERAIRTGSWLGLRFQGRGLGTEMRAGALGFAFEHLGAQHAYTEAFEDNAASRAVNRKLGYVHEGEALHIERRSGRPERPVRALQFHLRREQWLSLPPPFRVTVSGLGDCRALLGA